MKKTILALAIIAGTVIPSFSQPKQGLVPKAKDYTFTTIKENPITPVKNQYRSGTCWCFSALSFLESEVLKAKHITDTASFPDLSEMYVVRKAYHDRAVKYVRLNGHLNFAAGSGLAYCRRASTAA